MSPGPSTTGPRRSPSSRASRRSASAPACTSATPPSAGCTTWSSRSSTTRSTRRWRLLQRHRRSTMHIDGSVTVEDNGRGIPVEIHPQGGHLRRRGRADQAPRRRQVRQRRLQGLRRPARRRRLGGERAVRDARGRDQARRQGLRAALPPRQAGGAAGARSARRRRRGTKVTFKPDAEIFERTDFSFDILSQRLRELAFLNRGVRIVIEEQATEKRHEFLYKGGIEEFVEHLNRAKTPIHPTVIYARRASARTSRSRSRCSGTRATPRRSSPSPTTSTPSRAART